MVATSGSYNFTPRRSGYYSGSFMSKAGLRNNEGYDLITARRSLDLPTD